MKWKRGEFNVTLAPCCHWRQRLAINTSDHTNAAAFMRGRASWSAT